MNKFCFVLFCVLSFDLAAQLPHGFSLRENKDRAFQGTYETDVRKLGKHLCFETNILLIKDEKGVFRKETPLPEGLLSHPIVPNLYIYASKSSTFDDLKKEKEAFESSLGVAVFYNQVFTLETNTNDPNYNRQWAIENLGGPLHYNGTVGADMQVSPTWNLAKGQGVKVAILDSGVDTLHPDLLPNLLPGFDAYADSLSNTHGYPTPNFSSDGHGTACAGIVSAAQDNSIGTSGIAPEARVIPIRIFYYLQYAGNIGVQPFTSTLGLLNGAAYAWRIANCDLMSTSAGLSDVFIQALQINTQLINEEIDSAYLQGRNGLGVAMFFSAGNDDVNDVLWPANLPTTIAVGASDMCDQRKNPNDCSGENWGSTYGDHLDFLAPGVKIATTDMLGSYGYSTNALTLSFNGTSAACPNAAGVAALLLEANPNLTKEQIRQILSWTAEKVTYSYDSLAPLGTWDFEAGYGRINAYAAVQWALNTLQSTLIEKVQYLSFGANPNHSISFKNISNTTLTAEIVDLSGRGTCIILAPNQEYQGDFASGIYWVSCKDQRVKCMVN